MFGDQVIAMAILDRLLHHSTTLNIKGKNYRLKDKRKAGIVPGTTQPQEGSGGHGYTYYNELRPHQALGNENTQYGLSTLCKFRWGITQAA